MTILLLGDLTGRSRVALRMLTYELEARGHEVLALPTALISNTLNLGSAAILDTTDYLMRSLETWEKLGLTYDALYIGFVTGVAQAEKLCEIAEAAKKRGIPVVVDPILGDNGKKYNSVGEEQARAMAMLVRHADILTPNLTEACLMTDTPCAHIEKDENALRRLIEKLSEGKRSVLVTSAGNAVVGYDAKLGQEICVPFTRVAGEHWGTGDRFCALLLDGIVQKKSLADAAKDASRGVYDALIRGE